MSHKWDMQLKQHTTPCGCVNSLFTGGFAEGILLGTLLSGPDLVAPERALLIRRPDSASGPLSYIPARNATGTCLFRIAMLGFDSFATGRSLLALKRDNHFVLRRAA